MIHMEDFPTPAEDISAKEADTLRLEIAELKRQLTEKEDRLRVLEGQTDSSKPEEKNESERERIKTEILESAKGDILSSFLQEMEQNKEIQQGFDAMLDDIGKVFQKEQEGVFHRLPTRHEDEQDFYKMIADVSKDLFETLEKSTLKPEDANYFAKLLARYLNGKLGDDIEFTYETSGIKKKISVQIQVPMINEGIDPTRMNWEGPSGFGMSVMAVKEWGLADKTSSSLRKALVVSGYPPKRK